LDVRRNRREVVKATKSKLHQVGGAYFRQRIDPAGSIARLREAAATGDPAALKNVCRDLMSLHASTRERLEILDEFYADVLAEIPPVQTIIDLACGLNPLAWPWMGLDDHIVYDAYDTYADVIALLKAFMDIVGLRGNAEVRDLLTSPPPQPADLAMILKSLPCLQQIDKAATSDLLDSISARHLLITFPVHSLGGRGRGMIENYEATFIELAKERGWEFKRFLFSSELAFLVETGRG